MRKLEKCWCGYVPVALWTTFVCGANVRWTAERYPFGVGTSKKNMFAMLGICLTRWTPNKPLFGIPSGSPPSHMPRLCSHTNVNIPSCAPICSSIQTRTAPFGEVRTCVLKCVPSFTVLHYMSARTLIICIQFSQNLLKFLKNEFRILTIFPIMFSKSY